jgi:hypothetical protein
MALKHAEAAIAATQEPESHKPEKISRRREPQRRAKPDTKNRPRKGKAGVKRA